MNAEPHQTTCPRCQSIIQTDAPGGLCPKCLMEFVAFSSNATGSTTAFPNSAPDLDAIRSAFPNLEIIELAGQGGMGAVFKARQIKLDRVVALKILPSKLAMMPQFADRFEREGRLLAKLNHPNIIAVYDFGEQSGYFYLLMEFVNGVNLRQALSSSRFSPEQALSIIPRICEALQFAHDQGVLHRDIKPENILLDASGRIKIADFGIAKFIGSEMQTGLTATGATVGTPHYMAPEQFEHPTDVDHRADIYSLGVVFYEMLTGELPIGRFPAPSENHSMDTRIDSVVLRALEKNRERRQQSANEVRTEVESLCGGPPPQPQMYRQRELTGTKGMVWNTRAYVALLAVVVSFVFCGGVLGDHHLPGDAMAKILLTVVACIGMPGTLLAWGHLNQVRKSGIKAGRIPAVLASVTVPLSIFGLTLLATSIFIGQNYLKNISGIPDGFWLGCFMAIMLLVSYFAFRFAWNWGGRGPIDPTFLIHYRKSYFASMPAFLVAVATVSIAEFLLLSQLDRYADSSKRRLETVNPQLPSDRPDLPEFKILALTTFENVLAITVEAQEVPTTCSIQFDGPKLLPQAANLASESYKELCFFPSELRSIQLRFTELSRQVNIAFAFPDVETATACKNRIERLGRTIERNAYPHYAKRSKLFDIEIGGAISYTAWLVPRVSPPRYSELDATELMADPPPLRTAEPINNPGILPHTSPDHE